MKKALFVVGGAVGFVLGSRAGRGPYEKIETKVRKVAGRRDVQDVVGHVSEAVQSTASEASNKAKDAVHSAKDTVERKVEKAKTTAGDKTEAAAAKDQDGQAADVASNVTDSVSDG